jgi:hypothetical protein
VITGRCELTPPGYETAISRDEGGERGMSLSQRLPRSLLFVMNAKAMAR